MLSTKEFNRLLKLGNKLSKITTDEERLNFCKKNAKDLKITLGDSIAVIKTISEEMTDEQSLLISDTCKNGNNMFVSKFENCNGTKLLFKFIGIETD